MHALTIEQFKQALPDKVKKSINQELIDQINTTLGDPDMYETYRENMLSYASVMADGKFKLSGFISAVKYASHKLMGKTNIAAYSVTFPEKIQDWATRGVEAKDVASYVAAFNSSKMVTRIMEQALIPSWVLNQDLYQKALNVQAELMQSANSEKVRTDAANSLLTHLKMPETQKVELSVGVKPDSSIDALRKATMDLVAHNNLQIRAGVANAQQIAHQPLIIDMERVDGQV